MKIIEPNVELLPISITYDEMLRDIERAAGVCVASSKQHESVEEFIESLVSRKHYRPLEFGTIYVEIDYTGNKLSKLERVFWDIARLSPWSREYVLDNTVYLTTNYRVLQEISDLCDSLSSNSSNKLLWKDYVRNRWSYTSNHYNRHTFLWDVSRATADSFRTYTAISSLMQSTRYCNYSSNKFNSEITFIKPNWWEHDYQTTPQNQFTVQEHLFIRAWKNAEDYYISAIKLGLPAQHARGVLPLDIHTTFIQCAYEDDWDNFFNQRVFNTTGIAHDDAQLIAGKALELYKERVLGE